MSGQHERTMRALNILAKWRTLFTGWRRFPGVTATEAGLTIDRRALAWMKGWKP